jgi:hypothetical protein
MSSGVLEISRENILNATEKQIAAAKEQNFGP